MSDSSMPTRSTEQVPVTPGPTLSRRRSASRRIDRRLRRDEHVLAWRRVAGACRRVRSRNVHSLLGARGQSHAVCGLPSRREGEDCPCQAKSWPRCSTWRWPLSRPCWPYSCRRGDDRAPSAVFHPEPDIRAPAAPTPTGNLNPTDARRHQRRHLRDVRLPAKSSTMAVDHGGERLAMQRREDPGHPPLPCDLDDRFLGAELVDRDSAPWRRSLPGRPS